MRVRIESDGTPMGTRMFESESGEWILINHPELADK